MFIDLFMTFMIFMDVHINVYLVYINGNLNIHLNVCISAHMNLYIIAYNYSKNVLLIHLNVHIHF